MPITHRFDSTIVVMELAGEYSMDDVRSAIFNALADSQCPAAPCILIDLTESQSIYKRTPEDVKIMVGSLSSLRERFKRIALVAQKDLPYGLMRMGSVFSEEQGMPVEIFRDFASARNWLLS